ncbi:hypothetical protein FB45DRAFT_876529 [Roridomyces roridus]|uniref:Uncharacterized protein n=1 Tax=Roridomyces roridus TaxID=1738132 RepID=A0AAD7F8U2_9AGAR|nr:hypothetical protein FB45DRAFT_876529 [Roridomyces roridus]
MADAEVGPGVDRWKSKVKLGGLLTVATHPTSHLKFRNSMSSKGRLPCIIDASSQHPHLNIWNPASGRSPVPGWINSRHGEDTPSQVQLEGAVEIEPGIPLAIYPDPGTESDDSMVNRTGIRERQLERRPRNFDSSQPYTLTLSSPSCTTASRRNHGSPGSIPASRVEVPPKMGVDVGLDIIHPSLIRTGNYCKDSEAPIFVPSNDGLGVPMQLIREPSRKWNWECKKKSQVDAAILLEY